MTEVYSILNQAQTNDLWFVPIIFGVFGGVIFLVLLIRFIQMITTQNFTIGKLISHIFVMGIMVLWTGLVIWGATNDKQTYADYCDALENGTCFVESGEPGRLRWYPYEDEGGNTVHGISFWLNDQYFDSFYAYGENNFSKRDFDLIQNSEIIEVKYIVDEDNENVILSVSVSTDQGA